MPQYKSLHQYSENQSANTLVLTFAKSKTSSASRCLTRLAQSIRHNEA